MGATGQQVALCNARSWSTTTRRGTAAASTAAGRSKQQTRSTERNRAAQHLTTRRSRNSIDTSLSGKPLARMSAPTRSAKCAASASTSASVDCPPAMRSASPALSCLRLRIVARFGAMQSVCGRSVSQPLVRPTAPHLVMRPPPRRACRSSWRAAATSSAMSREEVLTASSSHSTRLCCTTAVSAAEPQPARWQGGRQAPHLVAAAGGSGSGGSWGGAWIAWKNVPAAQGQWHKFRPQLRTRARTFWLSGLRRGLCSVIVFMHDSAASYSLCDGGRGKLSSTLRSWPHPSSRF